MSRVFNKYVALLFSQNLYTSSPFSEPLSLEMRNAPPGDVPQRMNPKNIIESDSGVSKITTPQQGVMLWLIGPIIAAAILCVLLVFFFITKRYLCRYRYHFLLLSKNIAQSGCLLQMFYKS